MVHFTLKPEGVRPNQKNVDAVVDFLRTKSAKDVRIFLGMANFITKISKEWG